jgi:S1-C subfamily serine protease
MRQIACPLCQHRNALNSDQLGIAVQCVKCGFSFTITGSAPTPTSPKPVENSDSPWFLDPDTKASLKATPIAPPTSSIEILSLDKPPSPVKPSKLIEVLSLDEPQPPSKPRPLRASRSPDGATRRESRPSGDSRRSRASSSRHDEDDEDEDTEPKSSSGARAVLIGGGMGVLLIASVVGIVLAARSKNSAKAPANGSPVAAKMDGGAAANGEEADPEPGAKMVRPQLAGRAEFKPEEIAERLIRSTVLIVSSNGLGSGVLVNRNPNVVLTNEHVAGESGKHVTVFFPDVDENNEIITKLEHYQSKKSALGIAGKVVSADAQRDIALVEISRAPKSAVPIPFCSTSAKKLERVYGIGHSGVDFGSLWQPHTGDCRQLVDLPLQDGSGSCRTLLTQQPVNPGDSGGPVVNCRLELVGIVRAKASKFLKNDSRQVKGVTVEGLDNFAMVIDIAELNAYLDSAFEDVYSSSFNSAPSFIEEPAPQVGQPDPAP